MPDTKLKKKAAVKKIDTRLKPLAKLVCQQWDDEWGVYWRIHTRMAKDILRLIDRIKK